MSKFVIDLDDPQEKWDALYDRIEDELATPPAEETTAEELIPHHGFWLLAGLPES